MRYAIAARSLPSEKKFAVDLAKRSRFFYRKLLAFLCRIQTLSAVFAFVAHLDNEGKVTSPPNRARKETFLQAFSTTALSQKTTDCTDTTDFGDFWLVCCWGIELSTTSIPFIKASSVNISAIRGL